jgi:hypothetical protein
MMIVESGVRPAACRYASVVAAVAFWACQPSPGPAVHSDSAVLASIMRDTANLEQADRGPEMDALNRALGLIGIPYDSRLATDTQTCLTRGSELAGPGPISCEVANRAPPVVLRMVTDSGQPEKLEVLQGAAAVQSFDLLEFERPRPESPALYAEDLDGDGVREIVLQKFAGATGNRGYGVWRVDTATHRIALDSAMSTFTSMLRIRGRPCVMGGWNMSAYEHTSVIRCYVKGRWQDVWSTETGLDSSHALVRTATVRLNGVEHVIRHDTIRVP